MRENVSWELAAEKNRSRRGNRSETAGQGARCSSGSAGPFPADTKAWVAEGLLPTILEALQLGSCVGLVHYCDHCVVHKG